MNNKPSPDEVIQAVGVTAEMCWLFYKTSVNNGFSPEQALVLTQTYLSALLKKPNIAPNPDE